MIGGVTSVWNWSSSPGEKVTCSVGLFQPSMCCDGSVFFRELRSDCTSIGNEVLLGQAVRVLSC